MSIKSQVHSKFVSQIGYKETGTNITKYSTYFDTPKSKGGAWQFFNTKKQGAAWCAIFVIWVFCQILGPDKTRKFMGLPAPKDNCAAGVPYFWDYLVKKGWKVDKSKGQADDIIFFNNKKHVGFIEKVDSTKYYTVEGNKSNAVKRSSYLKTSTLIYGICRPKWSEVEPKPEPTPEPTPTPTPTPTPAPTTKKYQVVAKSGLKVRTGPGTKYTQVGVLNYGQTVTVYEIKDNWAKIDKSKARWACIKMGNNIYMKAV